MKKIFVLIFASIIMISVSGCMTPQKIITSKYNGEGKLIEYKEESESAATTFSKNLVNITDKKIAIMYDNSWLFGFWVTMCNIEDNFPTGKFLFGKKDKATVLIPADASPDTIKAVSEAIGIARSSNIQIGKIGFSNITTLPETTASSTATKKE